MNQGNERSPEIPHGQFTKGRDDAAAKGKILDARPIYLVNRRTDTIIVAVRLNGGQWQAINHIGQTCSLGDCEQCRGHWVLLCYIPCGQAVQLDVMDQNGGTWTGTPYTLDCRYSYGWYCLQ